MTDIWTAQYRYSGPDRLDITVKGNDPRGRIFAPTWDMVMKYKETGSEQVYTEAYSILLFGRHPGLANTVRWIYSQQQITLVCFCKPGAFCHRVILATWLVRAEYLGERGVA